MKNKIKLLVVIVTLMICLFPKTVYAAESEFNEENRIINHSDILTEEEIKDINSLSIEISNECNKNIYVYLLSETDGNPQEFLDNYAYNYNIKSNSYIIGINPYSRKLYIYNSYYLVDINSILDNYSREDFKNDDFYNGIINTMCGIADGYVRQENYQPPKKLITYNDIPTIRLSSYITDEPDILTAGQEEKIQSNSYRIKQNYGIDMYIMFTNSLADYEKNDYVTKVYNDNFYASSNTILILISLEDGVIHYSCGSHYEFNINKIYNTYAKSYFHLDEPDYVTGVCKLSNGVTATLLDMSIEDIENSVIEGTTVKIKDTESTKDTLKIILLVTGIVTLGTISAVIIKKFLIDDEKAKEKLINERPEIAFSELKEELSTVGAENIEYIKGVQDINQSMDDLYSEAASELINDELISEQHIKNKKTNIFDPRFEENNEDDVVISTIDDMIAKVVKECEGSKEYYEQLQAALDIYNSLSFTNRTKLNRSNTSQLETLTRKARMDKEYASRHI